MRAAAMRGRFGLFGSPLPHFVSSLTAGKKRASRSQMLEEGEPPRVALTLGGAYCPCLEQGGKHASQPASQPGACAEPLQGPGRVPPPSLFSTSRFAFLSDRPFSQPVS